MEHQGRYFPKTLLIAGFILVLFELLYIFFLQKWLNQWFFFKNHIPGLASLAILIFAGLVSYYEYHGFGSQEGIVRRGKNKSVIALTFDDGPNPKYTPKILDILKEKDAPATFFMVGKHVEKYPKVAQRVFQEGHEIGNHTYSHRDLVPATRKTVLKEVTKCDEALQKIVGIKSRLFRPPRGIYSNAVRKLLVEEGYTIVLWTVSAFDWSGLNPQVIVRRVKHYIRNGGVILFHDSGALIRTEGASRGNTVEALSLVIDELRDKGFEIVPLSQMLSELDHIEEKTFIEEVVGQEI